jgi:integrase
MVDRGCHKAPAKPETVAEIAGKWLTSRIDLDDSTRVIYRMGLQRILPLVGDRAAAGLTPADVAEAVAALHGQGYARSTIAKSLTALRLATDHAGITPNAARDPRVKLPREARGEIKPPAAAQVEAALEYVAPRYRLPLLLLEATGLRVGELEHLRWCDVEERTGRVRVSGATTKTRKARFAQVPSDLLDRVVALVPPDDRDPDARIFPDLQQANLRQELTRACKYAGIARFSPHDLRHRRISLLLHGGMPVHVVAAHAGHANAHMTLTTYAHVLVDDREIGREELLI